MKKGYCILVCALLLAGFIIQGCGSSDFTSGKIKEQNKDYKRAIEYYEKELQKNPTNYEAWFRMGRIKGEELNDYEGMDAAFREVEKLTSDKKDEIYECRYKAWANHLNAGVDLFKRVSPDSSIYYDKAIEEYKKSAAAWPDTSLTYYFLAQAYQGKDDVENTILCQKKIWELDHDKDSYKRAGRYLVENGLKKKDEFRSTNVEGLRIQKNLKDIDKGSYESDVERILGKPNSKVKNKRNRKKVDWKYNQYGLTLTIEGGRVVNKKFTRKIDLKIDSTKYHDAVAYFNRAVDIFEEVKKVNPKDNENLNLLLQAYYEADRIQEATDAFKLAVDNDPGNKMNHYILGLLYRTVNKNDEAIGEFNEAIKIDPNFSDALYDIGATYYNWGVKLKKIGQEKGDESMDYKKKFESALPWMIKVADMKTKNAQETASKTGQDWRTQLSPEDSRIWESIGTIYALLGKTEQATTALDEFDKIRKAISNK